MATRSTNSRKLPPPRTEEQREAQMANLAVELAEKQLRDGTASAMVITHYLKLVNSRQRLEDAKLGAEIKLREAQVDALESQARTEELISDALDAMRRYKGVTEE